MPTAAETKHLFSDFVHHIDHHPMRYVQLDGPVYPELEDKPMRFPSFVVRYDRASGVLGIDRTDGCTIILDLAGASWEDESEPIVMSCVVHRTVDDSMPPDTLPKVRCVADVHITATTHTDEYLSWDESDFILTVRALETEPPKVRGLQVIGVFKRQCVEAPRKAPEGDMAQLLHPLRAEFVEYLNTISPEFLRHMEFTGRLYPGERTDLAYQADYQRGLLRIDRSDGSRIAVNVLAVRFEPTADPARSVNLYTEIITRAAPGTTVECFAELTEVPPDRLLDPSGIEYDMRIRTLGPGTDVALDIRFKDVIVSYTPTPDTPTSEHDDDDDNDDEGGEGVDVFARYLRSWGDDEIEAGVHGRLYAGADPHHDTAVFTARLCGDILQLQRSDGCRISILLKTVAGSLYGPQPLKYMAMLKRPIVPEVHGYMDTKRDIRCFAEVTIEEYIHHAAYSVRIEAEYEHDISVHNEEAYVSLWAVFKQPVESSSSSSSDDMEEDDAGV